MGNYEQLKEAIKAVIKKNGAQEITGQIMQDTLLSIVSKLGSDATFAGVALPDTRPNMSDNKQFYIAGKQGTYVNFGGKVVDNEVVIFTNRSGSWVSLNTGIANLYGVTKSIQSEHAYIEDEVNRIDRVITELKQTDITDINEQLNLHDSEIAKAQGDITKINGDITKINGEITTINESLNKAADEIVRVDGKVDSSKKEAVLVFLPSENNGLFNVADILGFTNETAGSTVNTYMTQYWAKLVAIASGNVAGRVYAEADDKKCTGMTCTIAKNIEYTEINVLSYEKHTTLLGSTLETLKISFERSGSYTEMTFHKNQSGISVEVGATPLQKAVDELESTVYGEKWEKIFETTPNKETTIRINGYWKKGTIVKLSLITSIRYPLVYYGVTYPDGEHLNEIITQTNKSVKYVFYDDCTSVRVWLQQMETPGIVTMKIETIGERNNEYMSNYMFGATYKRKDSVESDGYVYARTLPVKLRAGTKVKISISSKTAVINSASFSFTYPKGEVSVQYQGVLNREIYTFLEDDCSAIGYKIDSVVTSGDIEFIVTSEPQIKSALIDGGTMSILGDSYSTYGLWIPDGNEVWYGINGEDGRNRENNNVNNVTQTWWYKLCEKLNVSLMLNESYSGSTICNTGYSGGDASKLSYIHRMVNSLGQGNVLRPKPNIIILFGGTNDSNANSPIGELKYSGWTEEDLKKVLPAMCYMFYYVKKWNPGALILNVVNTGLKAEIVNGFAEATKHYAIDNIVLSEIGKQNGHPNVDGMASICEQIYNYIKK